MSHILGPCGLLLGMLSSRKKHVSKIGKLVKQL
jgi:hypothetical protein